MPKSLGLTPPAIDVHAHAFPDSLAERALKSLTQHEGMPVPANAGTIAALQASMNQSNIQATFIANIATRPGQASAILEWSTMIRSPRIIPLGSVHPYSVNWENELDAIARAGLPGIKLHPLYQNFAVDAPEVLELYRSAARLNLFILFHAGFDLAFPNDDRSSPRRIAKVRESVPNLNIVAAHLGGWNAWDDVLSHLCGKDVYFDTSFMHDATPEQLRCIFQRHGSDRLLFGSDSPWQSQRSSLKNVVERFSTSNQLERVLSLNARELLRRSNGNISV